jgi:hypothetical protein
MRVASHPHWHKGMAEAIPSEFFFIFLVFKKYFYLFLDLDLDFFFQNEIYDTWEGYYRNILKIGTFGTLW